MLLHRHALAVYVFPGRGSCRVHQRVGIRPFLKGCRAAQLAVFVQHIAVQGCLHRRGAAAILQHIAAARTPEHNTLGLGQRQGSVLIFQQHCAVLNGFAGGLQQRIGIILRGDAALIFFDFHDKLQDVRHAVVQDFLGKAPLLHRLFAGGHIVRTGLNQIHTRRQRTFLVLPGCAPVTDNGAVEVQFPAQQICQQLFAIRGELPVHGVVGAHDAQNMSVLNGCLKPAGVQFHHDPLGKVRVRRVAVCLLVVRQKVLGAGRDTGALHTAHKGCRGLRHQLRILTVHLIVTAAQRVAGNVHIGAEADIHTCVSQFLPDCTADGFRCSWVKRRANVDARWEADMLPPARTILCRLLHKTVHQCIVLVLCRGLVEVNTVQFYHFRRGIRRARVIGTARICQIIQHHMSAIQPGRTVHQIDGRHVHIRDGPCVASAIAPHHIQFLVQCHLRNHLRDAL